MRNYPVLYIYNYVPGTGSSYLHRVHITMIRLRSHILDQADLATTSAESKAPPSFRETFFKQFRYFANTLIQTEGEFSTTCSI